MVVEAALRCAMVPAENTLLGPLVNRINRTPIDTMHAEVTNSVTVIATASSARPPCRNWKTRWPTCHCRPGILWWDRSMRRMLPSR